MKLPKGAYGGDEKFLKSILYQQDMLHKNTYPACPSVSSKQAQFESDFNSTSKTFAVDVQTIWNRLRKATRTRLTSKQHWLETR